MPFLKMSASLNDCLNEVGPLHFSTPRKQSNRGPKPMQSSVLTSPENISTAKTRQLSAKKSTPAKKQKANPAKKTRRLDSSSSEEDFCIICLETMPKRLTKSNSIKCNECGREVHLKCANITTSYFTCVNCESEYSD